LGILRKNLYFQSQNKIGNEAKFCASVLCCRKVFYPSTKEKEQLVWWHTPIIPAVWGD
jgi:hypothetical protein